MSDNADALRAMMKSAGITRQETADLLEVSIHTVKAWLKPDGAAGANPCPSTAVDALAWKLGRSRLPNAREREQARPEHRR